MYTGRREVMEWLTANWATVTAIVLAVVRLVESLMVVLPEKPKGIIRTVLAVIKEIFKLR